MRISIYRKAHFNAAHRLYKPEWDDRKNGEVYGLCASPNFHGHNYNIEVRLTGEVDPETGFLFNLKDLKQIIKQYVELKLDHKNLNLDVPELHGIVPSSENLCFLIWNLLRAQIDEKYDLGVKLWETERNYVRYPA